jgi:hypothetical protein
MFFFFFLVYWLHYLKNGSFSDILIFKVEMMAFVTVEVFND